MLLGMLLLTLGGQASADQIILVKGKVGSVIAGPSAEDTSDGGNHKDKKSPLASQASVSVEPTNERGAVFARVGGVPQFTTPKPAFKGTTTIQNASISLSFTFGDFVLRATVKANPDGTWLWASPEDFPNGNFLMRVVATHPTEVGITATTEQPFSVLTTDEITPWNQQYPDVTLVNLFDLSVTIQDEYSHIVPGANMIASIELINFNSTGALVNTLADYRIVDQQGREVLRQQETVVVGTKLSYFKAFYTQPDMKPGVYTLVVKTPSQHALALATADFTVGGKKEIQLTPTSKVDYTVVLLAIGAIFFTFIFLSYFEFIRFLSVKNRVHMVTSKFLKRFF